MNTQRSKPFVMLALGACAIAMIVLGVNALFGDAEAGDFRTVLVLGFLAVSLCSIWLMRRRRGE